MSCYWYLRCETCQVELDERWNHAGDELAELLEQREILERYAEVRRDGRFWRFTILPSQLEAIAEFLLYHRGHQVVAIDEFSRDRD